MTEPSSMADQIFVYPNGIDGSSGGFALPQQALDQLAGYIQRIPTDLDESRVIEVILQHHRRRDTYAFELPSDVDAQDLAQAGWGVIFPTTTDPSLVEILQPLLDWRRLQAGDLFKIFEPGYVYGESWIPAGFPITCCLSAVRSRSPLLSSPSSAGWATLWDAWHSAALSTTPSTPTA